MSSGLQKLLYRFGRASPAPAALAALLPAPQPSPQQSLQSAQLPEAQLEPQPTQEPVGPRPALALITYARADYFLQVFESIAAQTIRGRPFSEFFDLYVFQDGFWDADEASLKLGHQQIAEFCRANLPADRYLAQTTNLGVAMHFDAVERKLFVEEQRPWVGFFEDDLVLGPGYLETLQSMAGSFEGDARVGAFACFGNTHKLPLLQQAEQPQALTSLSHLWGFGMHQSAWLKRQQVVDEYLKLVSDVPYRARSHANIQHWHAFCGFNPGQTSQDYAKSCAMAALGMVKVASHANYGRYIGAKGLHFTPEIYAEQGFADSVLFDKPITQAFELDPTTFEKLLLKQRKSFLHAPEKFDFENFMKRLNSGALAPQIAAQWQSEKATEADVVAAYKIILGRMPESREVIESRVDTEPERLLQVFLFSKEFRARKQFHPLILALAKEILESGKK
jgi:hypothetical protein